MYCVVTAQFFGVPGFAGCPDELDDEPRSPPRSTEPTRVLVRIYIYIGYTYLHI